MLKTRQKEAASFETAKQQSCLQPLTHQQQASPSSSSPLQTTQVILTLDQVSPTLDQFSPTLD